MQNKKKVIIIIMAALLLLMAGGGLAWHFLKAESAPSTEVSNPDLVIDGSATDVQTQEQRDIQAELNRQVEEQSLCISMATNVVLADGTSEGEVKILNDSSNHYLMVVEIVRSDTLETIYKSDAIPVGKIIEKTKMDVDLEAGNYECVAYFNAYDPDTSAYIGKAGADIKLQVLS